MTLTELETIVPKLTEYTKHMPADIRGRCTIRRHPAGSIIHQKNMHLDYFGIVATGENRVVNEFENGNVYMIESNEAIDFVGEVTILAGMECTSVTIEAVTENIIVYISRKDAEAWLAQDINILRLTAAHTAFKLYRSSYNNGAKLFYPPGYLMIDYIVQYGERVNIENPKFQPPLTIRKTRQQLQEEIGINVKTLNRTISQLKEAGFFTLCKGKITLSREQFQHARQWLKDAGSQ